MKTGKRLILVLVVQNGLAFAFCALFITLYFRIYPNQTFLVYPAAVIFGLLFGLISYLPFKLFAEKK